MRQHDFYQARIERHDGEIRITQGESLIAISDAMLPAFVQALATEVSEIQSTMRRDAIKRLQADLNGTKPASVTPINGDGPEAA